MISKKNCSLTQLYEICTLFHYCRTSISVDEVFNMKNSTYHNNTIYIELENSLLNHTKHDSSTRELKATEIYPK